MNGPVVFQVVQTGYEFWAFVPLSEPIGLTGFLITKLGP